MRVFKFGGASVRDAESVKNVTNIIKENSDLNNLVVVLSAMGKTTNALEDIVASYLSHQDIKPHIAKLSQFHIEIVNELFEDKNATIYKQINKLVYLLEEKIKSFSIDDNSDKLYDQVVCFGELLSTHILSAHLNKENIPSQFVDARLYIQTDETWREGQLDWSWTNKVIQSELPIMLKNQIVVTQGFIGGTIGNETTTLGREGSDYTAAIFANCLDADSVTIWKDVPGIMTADPRRVPTAELYDYLSYKFAAELTYFGASVIHPKTIRPLALKQIPLNVRSFIQPNNQGTSIGNYEDDLQKTSIIFKKKQSLIKLEEKDFLNVNKANLASVFNELSRLNIKVNMVRSSAISFSLCVNSEPRKFESLIQVLSDHFLIDITDGLELITVRNFNETSFQKLHIDLHEILMEQKSEDTYQFVRKAHLEDH